ncbi:hypothetical protein FOH24_07155 [Acetobacter tropicalis]|uniref:Uncharacterized protein n=1 Tax=Acetobacter tropicalis TaxID=104102 RepID=A0A094YGI7_9PROT|nr:hypothetical protein [Acetobacter tropicalis]KAA8387065.1 hypothetical protein FOH22_10500 [Acetobacter tropicalis]KAA8391410.1 hypothetical protein FOH24_07155 [Acetobacter tropicalis]KGB21140.1 hypothetical protein AtDm6_3135 [Acetobacter tropicalis]MBC9008765.1 hypothetical protein [Acetobacter tropicalis]MDO8171938.1 hypothetical protein [Acetobacter tropicalis]
MGMVTRIVFLPYVWRLKGKKKVLEPGSPILCRSENDALRWVEKVRAGSLSVAGGRSVKMEVDEEAGDYGEPEILGFAGNVPEISEY